ncbi:hypothetical protein BDQ17DRAFT_484690 [Cyathus striatus]|nr:hypothetical protein BDQ17DRAFT_484690 [Cyathus striatus]
MTISYMPHPDDVSEWSTDTIEGFLKANMIAYNIYPWHIAFVKEKQVDDKILSTLEVASLLEMGLSPGGAVGISFLVRDIKKEKWMWVCPPAKRKFRRLPSDDDIRPRIKRRKIVTMSHSSIAKPSTYEVRLTHPAIGPGLSRIYSSNHLRILPSLQSTAHSPFHYTALDN